MVMSFKDELSRARRSSCAEPFTVSGEPATPRSPDEPTPQ